MATVLVTGVGGIGGTATVRSLQTHTSHDLVGVDMDPRARGFFLLDRFDTVPAADSNEWLSTMKSVVSRYDVDAIVPLVDEELARLDELREAVTSDVVIVAPRTPVIEQTLDKRRFARWIGRTDLPSPEWACPSDTDQSEECTGTDDSVTYPVVVKPRMGHGSQGVERVESPSALETYFESHEYDRTDVVIQECLDGTEFTTSVVATRDDRLLAVVPKEVVEKDGNTTWGVTRQHRAVEESCRRLFETLRPGGPINVQQIVDDETGTARIIEVNPRFSSTACLTVDAGVNELDLLIRDALKPSVAESASLEEPISFEPDLHLIRHTDHYVTRERDLEDGLPPGSPETPPERMIPNSTSDE